MSLLPREMLLYVYVLLSKAEKHVRYGELFCTTECVSLQMSCCTNRGRYNRVQLYLCCYSKWQPYRRISSRKLLKFLVFEEVYILKIIELDASLLDSSYREPLENTRENLLKKKNYCPWRDAIPVEAVY
jgi:hypothetical protein